MRKIIFVLSMVFLALFLAGCSNEEVVEYMNQRGYTFVDASCTTPRGSQVEACKYIVELSAKDKTTINDDIRKKYGFQPIQPATNMYNCHSYAWHSQSKQNVIWINKPDIYWLDGGYSYKATTNTKTIPSNVKAGDIAVWFDKNGVAQHSAIVKDPQKNIVVSKWGPGGLYEHPLNKSYYDGNPTIKFYSFNGILWDYSGPYPYPKYPQYVTY